MNYVTTKVFVAAVFVEEYSRNEMEPEQFDVLKTALHRGIPVQTFTKKTLSRRRLKLSPSSLVVGDHDVMKSVFKQMGVPRERLPADSYPPPLRPFLQRRVYVTTLRDLHAEPSAVSFEKPPVFIKPYLETKKFTGQVVGGPASGLFHHHVLASMGCNGGTKVYASEVVPLANEYRVFVHRGNIVGCRQYEGTDDQTGKALNQETVTKAVRAMEGSEHRTAAYALDFSIKKDTGETVLVEWNDAYALGSYGLDPATYYDMLVSRWLEIVGPAD